MYILMNLSKVIQLCNCHHNSVLEHSTEVPLCPFVFLCVLTPRPRLRFFTVVLHSGGKFHTCAIIQSIVFCD